MTTSYASDPKTSSDKTRWYVKLVGTRGRSAKDPMVVMSDSEDESEGEDQEREMRCRLVLTCFAPEGSPLIGLGASL